MLDRNIRDAAFVAFHDIQQRFVAAVHIVKEFKLAFAVHKGGLVGQVDGNRGGELNVGFAGAEHLADAHLGIAVARPRERQQYLRVFRRVLHPHAAVTERPPVQGEKVLVRCVVLIDQELVGEIEAQPAERVFLAGRLMMWTLPSEFLPTTSPARASTVGSRASAGRYSLWTIEGGTFQVGLTVMYFMSALMIGVGMVGLPSTTLVIHTCWPS